MYFKSFDGDEELARLTEKIEKDQEFDEYDILKLIFLPFMKSKKNKEERTIETVTLAKNINSKNRTFVIGAIIAITDNFLSTSVKKTLMEVLKMTEIEQWIREQGREEGWKEGIQKGLEKGREETVREKTKAALKAGLDVTLVSQIMGLDIEEVQKLKEELNKP
ncbi:hypothetical protein [Heliorestis convoluta]|uniref:Rpn family recombination-promoting nuclease/putative transposase n=1 Tax=Heliorestis convoluta TaxID=356322 RepID=A0A5Q2N0A6_9FIRM|nr:hypothetical protein [Heliorestis convoluta]QGG47209.1 Rpn family recombination-promoting nuclease/putative transposase [Heliorestis convoluta]